MAKSSSSFEVRLGEARIAVQGHYAGWCDEIEARDRIILEADADGWPPAQIARWAGISAGRVTQIVARRGAEAQAARSSQPTPSPAG
jgi:hypothetical protein